VKFITEEDLRDQYRKEAFTEYKLEPGTRITPGARQFLTDRGIQGFEDAPVKKSFVPVEASEPAEPIVPEVKKKSCSKKLYRKMKFMEALLLDAAVELLNRDVLLAQKVIGLSRSFTGVTNAMVDDSPCATLCVQSCTGINEANFSQNLDDCFEITEFHIQLGKGREIIVLHKLRCALREIEADLSELMDRSEDDKQHCEETAAKVNQIINTLSQMICSVVGGEKCQKIM